MFCSSSRFCHFYCYFRASIFACLHLIILCIYLYSICIDGAKLRWQQDIHFWLIFTLRLWAEFQVTVDISPAYLHIVFRLVRTACVSASRLHITLILVRIACVSGVSLAYLRLACVPACVSPAYRRERLRYKKGAMQADRVSAVLALLRECSARVIGGQYRQSSFWG